MNFENIVGEFNRQFGPTLTILHINDNIGFLEFNNKIIAHLYFQNNVNINSPVRDYKVYLSQCIIHYMIESLERSKVPKKIINNLSQYSKINSLLNFFFKKSQVSRYLSKEKLLWVS